MEPSPRSWVEAIHEEDRGRIFEQVGAGSVDGVYVCEFRIVRPDGTIRWILDRAYELRCPAGRPYRIVGVAEDVIRDQRPFR